MRNVNVAKADRKVAEQYVFESNSLSELCDRNARIASAHMRFDHARVFRILQSLFPSSDKDGTTSKGFSSLAWEIITRL
jgi:hypothetical protein